MAIKNDPIATVTKTINKTGDTGLIALLSMNNESIVTDMMTVVQMDITDRQTRAIRLGASWMLLTARKTDLTKAGREKLAMTVGYSVSHLRRAAQLFDVSARIPDALEWYQKNRDALVSTYSYQDGDTKATAPVGFIPAKMEGIDHQLSVVKAHDHFMALQIEETGASGVILRKALTADEALAEVRQEYAKAMIKRIDDRVAAKAEKAKEPGSTGSEAVSPHGLTVRDGETIEGSVTDITDVLKHDIGEGEASEATH